MCLWLFKLFWFLKSGTVLKWFYMLGDFLVLREKKKPKTDDWLPCLEGAREEAG